MRLSKGWTAFWTPAIVLTAARRQVCDPLTQTRYYGFPDIDRSYAQIHKIWNMQCPTRLSKILGNLLGLPTASN